MPILADEGNQRNVASSNGSTPSSNARRVVRSACDTMDYVMEGKETICMMRVPSAETPEYSRRVAEIVAAPQLVAAGRKALTALSDENATIWDQEGAADALEAALDCAPAAPETPDSQGFSRQEIIDLKFDAYINRVADAVFTRRMKEMEMSRDDA